MNAERLCQCSRPLPEGLGLCGFCRTELEKHVGDFAWLDDQLEISMTRAKAVTYNGGAPSRETALPFAPKAADVRHNLRNTVVGWIRVISTEHGIKLPSRDPMRVLAAWLTVVMGDIVKRTDAATIYDELTYASQAARAVVFFKPAQRIYLGPCGHLCLNEDDETITFGHCPGEVYADEFADEGKCEACGCAWVVATKKADIDQQLSDRLMTPAEIATAALRLGADLPRADRKKVRNIVAVWAKRGTIVGREVEGETVYRYGDVRPLLYEAYGEAVEG